MTRTVARRVLAIACASISFPTLAADIVLTPPAGGGVSVTNAAGNSTRFRVADDGTASFTGSLVLVPSTATAGNIAKGASRFIHDFGVNNTFVGVDAGNFTMTGNNNTAIGFDALRSNAGGHSNTASGSHALSSNTTGFSNVAGGSYALYSNTTGNSNTAFGMEALYYNTSGVDNTAIGLHALGANAIGTDNAAIGKEALYYNTSGSYNTASGRSALRSNLTGNGNVAVGYQAAVSTTGSSNIAVGYQAGYFSTGSFNIAIGNVGDAADAGTIRIGTVFFQQRAFVAGIRGTATGLNNAVPVVIDSAGQLGTINSSRRYKEGIADMREASADLMRLRPVTFHYKSDATPSGRRLQYGLVAEEVAQVYPGLVAHSDDGEVETVMYQFLPTMLLNEYQKQQRTIQAQAKRIEELEKHTARVAELERKTAWLVTTLEALAGNSMTRTAAAAQRP